MASTRILIAALTLAQCVIGQFANGWHGAWPLMGDCVAVWASPGKYVLPYTVQFEASQFFWTAGSADGGTLYGEGAVIGPVTYKSMKNGSFATEFFTASRYHPDTNRATHCSCTYARVSNKSATITYYAVAILPNSTHFPMLAVCKPHSRGCPSDNETAFAQLGAPFVEEYADCISREVQRQLRMEMLAFVYLLAAGGLLIILILVSSKCGGLPSCIASSSNQRFAEDISEWDLYRKELSTSSTMSPNSSVRSMLNLEGAWTPEPGPSRGSSSWDVAVQSHWSPAQTSADWLRTPFLLADN